MSSTHLTKDALGLAKSVLLEPFGLDEPALVRAIGGIFTHQVDYADLYFQFTKNESWSLEEGIVKTGSFSIDKGVGVRAVSGDKTAFSYSDDISMASLEEAAKATRTIGRQGAGQAKVATSLRSSAVHSLYIPNDPLQTISAAEKVAILEKVEKLAKATDPRIVQVMAGLAGEFDIVMVVRSDGTLAADVRPLIRLSVTVIAEENGRREMGTAGGGGRYGYTYFTDELIRQYVDEATRSALVNLEAMHYKLPVISTDEGGIRDIVEDGVTGFIVPKENATALAEKIAILIDDGELRRKMGEAGYKRYKELFTLPIFETRFVQTLQKVCAQR